MNKKDEKNNETIKYYLNWFNNVMITYVDRNLNILYYITWEIKKKNSSNDLFLIICCFVISLLKHERVSQIRVYTKIVYSILNK